MRRVDSSYSVLVLEYSRVLEYSYSSNYCSITVTVSTHDRPMKYYKYSQYEPSTSMRQKYLSINVYEYSSTRVRSKVD
jgi:hypothetical protein